MHSEMTIRHVCAALLAATATGASAQQAVIADYAHNAQAGLNVNVYISGSTAIDNTIAAILTASVRNICQANTITEYLDTIKSPSASGTTIGNAAEYMYYCQAGVSSGVSTSDFIAVFKESTAGSINGAAPLINVAKGGSSGLTFMNPEGPDVGTSNCFPAGAAVGSGGTSGGTACTAGDFQQNIIPTGGVTDVEANLLRGIPGGGALSLADIARYLAGSPGLDAVWGIAVTKNLYYALQAAEGLSNGSVISTCNGGTSVDLPQCAPSLSKEQIAALLVGPNNGNGSLLTWNQVLPLSNPGGDNNVYICRQSIGAGIVASFDAAFLGARCGTSSEDIAAQDGQYVVTEPNTWGTERCLSAFYGGGGNGGGYGPFEITPFNGDFSTSFPPFTPQGNQWAIGIMSTEITPSNRSFLFGSGSDAVRFIAVDGVLPTLANVANGYYAYFWSDIWYHIPAGLNGSVVGTPAFRVFSAIESLLGHPGPTHDVNQNYANMPWGSGGELAPASLFATAANAGYTSFPVTTNEVEANPINLFTRASGGSFNSCDEPVLFGNISAGLAQSTPVEGTLVGQGNVNQH